MEISTFNKQFLSDSVVKNAQLSRVSVARTHVLRLQVLPLSIDVKAVRCLRKIAGGGRNRRVSMKWRYERPLHTI